MKNNNKVLFLSLCVFVIAFIGYYLYASSQKNRSVTGIKPPFEEIDIPFQEYIFSNDTSFTVYTETGTRVHIPAGAIEIPDANSRSGPLTLKIREFHGSDQLFRSGMPMQVAGTDNFLQSAGMLDIRVYQKKTPATLKEGRNIEVDLASYKSAKGYDLYYLENDRQWGVTDTFKSIPNPIKQRVRDSLSVISMPVFDTTSPKEDFVFDLYIDTVNTPQLKALHGLSWRIPSEYNNAKLRNAMRVHWNKVSVETINKRKQKYRLIFERYLNIAYPDTFLTKTFSVPVEPVLSSNSSRVQKKNLQEQIAEYETAIERWKQEEDRIVKQAELVNSFRINRFGVWNIDKVTSEKDYMNISVAFDFENMKGVDPDGVIVYGLYKEINTVIPYTKSEWKRIRFPVNGSLRLIAVITDKKAAIVEDGELRNAVLNKGTNIVLSTKQVSADKIRW